ncbi:MAG TPA: hypothetical protein G4O03_02475 [Dehalococcoidia bacterium]|jgi:disulfide oxidoreductase YuzD|nr:hypothetical protein [Dehalococcoidia bacterium]
MAARPLRVVIFDDSQGHPGCDAECGLDLRSLRVQQEILERLRQRFGEGVSIEYHDLHDPQIRDQHPDIAERVAAQSLELPLLLINGKPRIAGYFDARMLVDMIEAEMEMGSG